MRIYLIRPHGFDKLGDHDEGSCAICAGIIPPEDGRELQKLGVTAYAVLPPGIREPKRLPSGVDSFHLVGWNGSYHDPVFYRSAGQVVLYVTGRRAGRLGKLRKACKAALEEARPLKRRPIPEFGKTVAIRKGIYREGD